MANLEVGKTTGTWERLRTKSSHILYVDKKLYIKNTYVMMKGQNGVFTYVLKRQSASNQ